MEDQILFRFLNGECTSKELEEIELWMSLDKSNAQWLFEIEEMWALRHEFRFGKQEELESAFAQLKLELDKRSNSSPQPRNIDTQQKAKRQRRFNSPNRFVSWGTAVAAAILLVFMSVNIWQMVFSDSGRMNIIEVPRGSRASLTLSDGTKVWLNSDSKLTYPQEFGNKGDRLVLLEGEGFFDVTRDVKHPFIVHSNRLEVKVLGTKFNFKAYPEETDMVFLKEGKVKVALRNSLDETSESIVLYPNDLISYSHTLGFSSVQTTNYEVPTSWVKGGRIFTNETLRDIVKSLEREYNVSITIKDPILASERYNCRVQENVSLAQILDLLKGTGDFDYKIENDQVVLFEKNKI